MSKPTVNDVVFIPRALARGRFIITAIKRSIGRNYVRLWSEHDGAHAGGWQLQNSVEHCASVMIVNHRRGKDSITEAMSGCAYQPELFI